MEIVQRTVAQIPWRSNITLLDKLSASDLRLWYAKKTLEHGFGKDMYIDIKIDNIILYFIMLYANKLGLNLT